MTPTLKLHLFQICGLGRYSQDLNLSSSSSWSCFFPPPVCPSLSPPLRLSRSRAYTDTHMHTGTLSPWKPLLCTGWTCLDAEPAGPAWAAQPLRLGCTHAPGSTCDRKEHPRVRWAERAGTSSHRAGAWGRRGHRCCDAQRGPWGPSPAPGSLPTACVHGTWLLTLKAKRRERVMPEVTELSWGWKSLLGNQRPLTSHRPALGHVAKNSCGGMLGNQGSGRSRLGPGCPRRGALLAGKGREHPRPPAVSSTCHGSSSFHFGSNVEWADL